MLICHKKGKFGNRGFNHTKKLSSSILHVSNQFGNSAFSFSSSFGEKERDSNL